MSIARLNKNFVEPLMDFPDTRREEPHAFGTFAPHARGEAQISMRWPAPHLHVPMPPEVDPDIALPPPPNIDPDPVPDDPIHDPHPPPEGDPPAAPPPVRASSEKFELLMEDRKLAKIR
ncbi:hypothetical protein [Paraburkholderia sp. HD33-4]|uniref:hypothetical protein n=1 Tax=Paraburkholderia sp. HD33-4 TaxID=2883242 RepID=UPI001F3A2352|nr:hypothetical protein [Paraburkholderia sp. HD33-4]